jgi:Anaphase-promoting complex subunit 11 RING-H2 finger
VYFTLPVYTHRMNNRARRVHKHKQTRRLLEAHRFQQLYALSTLIMKVIVKQWHAIAQWQWDTGKMDENGDPDEDVCGICRVPFEGCCPTCKVPGDDCPLSRFLLVQSSLHKVTDNT